MNKPRGFTLSDFKIYYKCVASKHHGLGIKTDIKSSGTE
jgi:hypothetical protein